MNASLDTDVVIHLYRSGKKELFYSHVLCPWMVATFKVNYHGKIIRVKENVEIIACKS